MPIQDGKDGGIPRLEKTLFLHIGYGKTGTSSLQSFFARNGEPLEKFGIYYPITGRDSLDAHHYIATAARPGGGTGYDTDVGWEVYLSRLGDEISARPEPNVLISSEVFSGRMTWRLLNMFKLLFAEIRVVIYLRRQDMLIASSYNQWVKGENLTKRLSELRLLPLNFDVALEKWESFIGDHRGGLIVRPYERGQVRNGNVVDDFMDSVFGISVDGQFTPPDESRANQRLSLDALEFKRLLNCQCPSNISSIFIGPLVRYSEHALSAAPEDPGAIFTPRQRREIMEVFEPGNAAIARRYMKRPNGVLFMTSPPEQDDDSAPPTLTYDGARDIARYILADPELRAVQEGAAGGAGAAAARRLWNILDAGPAHAAAADENSLRALVRDVAVAICGDFPERSEEDLVGQRWAKI